MGSTNNLKFLQQRRTFILVHHKLMYFFAVVSLGGQVGDKVVGFFAAKHR